MKQIPRAAVEKSLEIQADKQQRDAVTEKSLADNEEKIKYTLEYLAEKGSLEMRHSDREKKEVPFLCITIEPTREMLSNFSTACSTLNRLYPSKEFVWKVNKFSPSSLTCPLDRFIAFCEKAKVSVPEELMKVAQGQEMLVGASR